jgi:hypothetical protein
LSFLGLFVCAGCFPFTFLITHDLFKDCTLLLVFVCNDCNAFVWITATNYDESMIGYNVKE